MAHEHAPLRHGGEATAGLFERVRRAVEVPQVLQDASVEPGLDMTEPAALDNQVRLHRAHVFQNVRRGLLPQSLGDFVAYAKIMISPDADGPTFAKERDHVADTALAKQGIAGVPKRHDHIYPPATELRQRLPKRVHGFVNVRDNADAHR